MSRNSDIGIMFNGMLKLLIFQVLIPLLIINYLIQS